MKASVTIGERIRELRKSRKLSQKLLAGKLDIDSSLLAKFERNERIPTNSTILKLASFFDVESQELLSEALSDRIASQILVSDSDVETLKVAELKVDYLMNKHNNKYSRLTTEDELITIPNVNNDKEKFTTVSLFSGCGGMDQGFVGGFSVFAGRNKLELAKNAFDIVWANDIDKGAVNSYRLNFGEHVHHMDISDVLGESIPDCDIVIGGFPCQDFSIAGKQKGFASERGNLYKQMSRIIREKRPKAFVAENVKNILNPNLIDAERGQPVIQTIIEDFAKLGYDIKYRCLYAPDFGIPQRRERVFIVGIRKDLKKEFRYPLPIHKPMTSKQAIDDLWGKENNLKIHNHNQVSLAKFRPPSKHGMQGNEMIPENGPSHTMRAEHHMNIQAHYRTTDSSKDINDRRYWRRLTVREAARLQTFPDNFRFVGSKSDCYKQVGNAVPPMLAWYIAKALELCLKSEL